MIARYLVGSAAALIGALWAIGAAKAGYFLTDRSAFVPDAGDPPLNDFSRRKKYAEIDGWRVAYVDEGSGPPSVNSGKEIRKWMRNRSKKKCASSTRAKL